MNFRVARGSEWEGGSLNDPVIRHSGALAVLEKEGLWPCVNDTEPQKWFILVVCGLESLFIAALKT